MVLFFFFLKKISEGTVHPWVLGLPPGGASRAMLVGMQGEEELDSAGDVAGCWEPPDGGCRGAGGGGCMIALTRNPKETSEAIELAGGRTLISKIAAQGMAVDSDDNSPLWNPFE